MKTARTFKASWYFLAIVVTILIGEVVAWEVSSRFGFRNNPYLVAVLSAGLVGAVAAVLYEGADLK